MAWCSSATAAERARAAARVRDRLKAEGYESLFLERRPVRRAEDDPVWARLEDQLGWYDRKSGRCQRKFKGVKAAHARTLSLCDG